MVIKCVFMLKQDSIVNILRKHRLLKCVHSCPLSKICANQLGSVDGSIEGNMTEEMMSRMEDLLEKMDGVLLATWNIVYLSKFEAEEENGPAGIGGPATEWERD